MVGRFLRRSLLRCFTLDFCVQILDSGNQIRVTEEGSKPEQDGEETFDVSCDWNISECFVLLFDCFLHILASHEYYKKEKTAHRCTNIPDGALCVLGSFVRCFPQVPKCKGVRAGDQQRQSECDGFDLFILRNRRNCSRSSLADLCELRLIWGP